MQDLPIKAHNGDYMVRFVDEPPKFNDSITVAAARFEKEYPDAIHYPSGEATKNLEVVVDLAKRLREHGANKNTVLTAVGGGTIQDLVCFTAHCYLRGLRWRYVPTTLMAMVDSCVGGKSAMNVGQLKNQLGIFHSPFEVVIYPRFTDTLPRREVLCGYGELAKTALLDGDWFYDLRGPDAVSYEDIRHSLDVKRRFVEQDEFDNDVRLFLGYGHTFGHAIEAVTQWQVAHGVGVAWGCIIANRIAEKVLGSDLKEANNRLIEWFGPVPELPKSDLLKCIQADKKADVQYVNMVLMEDIGAPMLVPIPYLDLVNLI